MIIDIKNVVDQVSRDRGISRESLIKALEDALKSAARKKFGADIDIDTIYDDESGEIEVFQFKEVSEVVDDPSLQISLEEGLELDAECEIGDSLGVKMDTDTFGRIAAQSAKQVIIQKMREAERSTIYDQFVGREGEIINGIVQRIERGNVIANIGEAEAILTRREQIPGESYRRGDRLRANIIEVHQESSGPQIILSRSHADFVSNLFKTEVPEVSEGIITIKAVAREAGGRTKIAVVSNDNDIDPVGACVGVRGNRIQNVVKELKGEKIDIVPWNANTAKFVCNALSPAEIIRVIMDEDNESMVIVVADEAHSIAIGRRGQNVRLASKLTGWQLDIQSDSVHSSAMEKGYASLLKIPDMDQRLSNELCEMGFFSAADVARADIEDLIELEGIDEEAAGLLIENAAIIAAMPEPEPEPEPDQEADESNASEKEAAEGQEEDNVEEADDSPADGDADDSTAEISD